MKTLFKLIAISVCAGVLGLGGCSNDDPPGPPATDVTGDWSTTTWISAYDPGNVLVTWNLTQMGSAISGSFHDNLNNSGSVSGSIGGYEVFLTFRYAYYPNRVVDVEATVSSNSAYMSATFRGEGEVKLGTVIRQLATQ